MVIAPTMIGCGQRTASSAQEKKDHSNPANTRPTAAVEKGDLYLDRLTQQKGGIETLIIAARNIPQVAMANGSLVTNEDRTWRVSSYFLGRVAEVSAKVGDVVKEGQILARMHSHEVHDARATYQQASAQLTETRAQESFAKKARDRAQRLFALEAISKGQLEQAEADWQKAKAVVESAQAIVNREKVHITDVLQVPLNPVPGHESAELVPVVSPARGIIMERLASIGTVVNPGSPMFTVADLSTLWLIASVNEAELGKVLVKQPVEVRVRAYPDRIFPGSVLKLGEQLDPVTRTLQVRALVSNLDEALKPEMYATAIFQEASTRPALTIPETSVQEINGQQVVFRQLSDAVFRSQVVNVGTAVNGQVEIREGLKDGDHVVVKGSYSLKSEMLKKLIE